MVIKYKPLSLFLGLVSATSTSFAVAPFWTYSLVSGKNVQSVAENVTGTLVYKIKNQTTNSKNLVLAPTNGLVQMNSCYLRPRGYANDSCTVKLRIVGSQLAASGIHGGPSFCLVGAKGKPNYNQCFQPNAANSLNITKTAKLEDWDNWGQNPNNTSHNINSGITKDSVKKLAALCKIDYTEGLALNDYNHGSFSDSAKPVIVNDTLYWNGFAGKIGAHKIQRDEYGNFTGCKKLWVQDVSNLLGISSSAAVGTPSVRSSPAYYKRSNGSGALLYLAIDNPFGLADIFSPPLVAFALDSATGAKLWEIPLVDASEVGLYGESVLPSTTFSPRIYNGTAYLGFSSLNNAADELPQTFRGHMIALNLGGQGMSPDMPSIKWTQYTIPPRPSNYKPGEWFAGGGIWASAPSIVPELGLVIYGSGQLYNYPDFTKECMERPASVKTATFTTTKLGETGGGTAQCMKETEAKLLSMGIKEPLATNSIIALNMKDGSYAWHVPTSGIDNWKLPCGINVDQSCIVPVPGPDWDVSGSAPIVANLKGMGKVVISHNKGGEVFWINAASGKVLRRADVCVGSAIGGIDWGLGYDPDSQTLYAACAAGGNAPRFGGTVNFMSILANGRKICSAGHLDAIDANTGALKWQTLPENSEIVNVNSPGCPDKLYVVDERFKYGIKFDVVIKNKPFKVPVNIMPENKSIPLAKQQKARANGVAASSNGVVYWPVYYGAVYALDSKTGGYLNQFICDQGAMYSAGPSVAKGLLAFGCGYGSLNPADYGKSIMVFGLPNIATQPSK